MAALYVWQGDNSCVCARCDNELYGCTVVVKLDILALHLKECEHNPKKPVPCSQGCGLTVPKDEMVTITPQLSVDCVYVSRWSTTV